MQLIETAAVVTSLEGLTQIVTSIHTLTIEIRNFLLIRVALAPSIIIKKYTLIGVHTHIRSQHRRKDRIDFNYTQI